MKKVLLAISTLNGGGAERVVSVWSDQLAKEGYDVSIVLFGRTEGEYSVSNSVKIFSVSNTYEEYTTLNYLQKIGKMKKILRQIRPDITINFLPRVQAMMLLATLGTGIRRIETVRVSPWALTDDNWIAKQIWLMCFRFSSRIIIQTKEQGEFFNRKIRKKCVTIPNPISKECIDTFKKEYSKSVTKFVAAGRIDRQKNYEMMIKAFARAAAEVKKEDGRQITLDIFGSGNDEYNSILAKLITELKADQFIRLMGRSDRLHEKLVKYDAFLMSSDYEGMPNSLAEAMALGLVCISTDCRTGPKDMIRDKESGFLVKTGDEELFANKIHQVCCSESVTRKVGEKAREAILELTNEEKSLRALIRLIEEVAKQ